MAKTGVAPLDPTTLTGQARNLIGDSDAMNIVEGVGEYQYFSDAEILGFLSTSGQSPLRAAGSAVSQLATSEALKAVLIVDQDLQVNTNNRALLLKGIADTLFKQADAEYARNVDILNRSREAFDLFTVVSPEMDLSSEQLHVLQLADVFPPDPFAPDYYVWDLIQDGTIIPDPTHPGYYLLASDGTPYASTLPFDGLVPGGN